jgi:hypothetical protein
VVAALVFLVSPVHQVSDSHYSMVLSESLLKHRSFVLDRYFASQETMANYPGYDAGRGVPLHIEAAGGHLYYQFPPGSSILSVPYVGLMSLLGVSPVRSDRSYDPAGEIRIERGLATILMALVAWLFFVSACRFLPTSWSATVALAGVFATPIWSTASRAMWAHTWSVLLTSIVILLLIRLEARQPVSPFLLATLASWMIAVRPANVVIVLVMTIYVVLTAPRLAPIYILTGALWGALFAAYSFAHFGTVLPFYLKAHAGGLHFGASFWRGLAGVLFSPSRGLFVFVPSLIFVGYLLVALRSTVPCRRLVALSSASIVVTVVLYATYVEWWGGHSFGARYMTDLTPWIVLLAILTLAAARAVPGPGARAGLRRHLMVGLPLTLVGVAINATGAWSRAATEWNAQPADVNMAPERLWDWRRPQFLAPVLPASSPSSGIFRLPSSIPLYSMDVRRPEALADLKGFWRTPDQGFRWSVEPQAAISIDLREPAVTVLHIKAGAFSGPGLPERQRVRVAINGQSLATFEIRGAGFRTLSLRVPADSWVGRNVLTFDLPDARSPWSVNGSDDRRALGLALQSVSIYLAPSP